MAVRLKPISDQVIVITGATSGHGLGTAQKAAAAGARVMLAARDGEALARICEAIRAAGGVADHVVTDVGIEADVERLADETIARFGGFDSWVNNAGAGVYALLSTLPIDEHRKVFETNYWGIVHGSLIALRHLESRPGGGALINIGSINGDMGAPLLGAYSASKHAVKGFTDSLRIELMQRKAPVSLTLIKPSAIGTPFPDHGRNHTGYRARLPDPVYSPDLVADAILDAAQHRRRAVTVGGVGKLQVLGATLFPSLFDRLATTMNAMLVDRTAPVPDTPGNLYAPQGDDRRAEGRQHGRRFSLFSTARRHGALTAGAAVAVAMVAIALRNARDSRRLPPAPAR
ncbi:SDR family oxidoreductase [Sphingomonas sp. HF-S3]|uniref:SDR family oxidoreductase n=1 Tax=Sphingomonas rustica TaxID=3103142 RepID=A0ABV0B8L0_9SPHN